MMGLKNCLSEKTDLTNEAAIEGIAQRKPLVPGFKAPPSPASFAMLLEKAFFSILSHTKSRGTFTPASYLFSPRPARLCDALICFTPPSSSHGL